MRRFLLLAAAASLLTSGCGTQVTGTATTSAPSSARLPSDGAPAVTAPINDTARVERDPCSAIPTAEIEAIGGKVERFRTVDLSEGLNCSWLFLEAPSTVSAGLVLGNKDGLSALYAQNSTGGLTTFKPVDPVGGHPAVIYANGSEGRGTCTLAVGIRDDLVYTVIPHLSSGNPMVADPCGMATKVAATAIKHLKRS
ncbi:DUF3558 domain-containing protein [Amycolatopsis sp. WAC 01376]|uniref:DUF3558 domain-containing protein n=1 Tax=Amycolatopsis sp. WAC 01376 TaxID=2203195 RepID=UPI000F76FA0A|nr:DUF3558 domain-containing protein [Amycolatopsis sp. WAC 01376]RSM66513.1 DUF3558 domain-containing protein [Amycolatopsis sp. WAC 01376]